MKSYISIRKIILVFFAISLLTSISAALIMGGILLLDWVVQCARGRSPWVREFSYFHGVILAYLIWGGLVTIINKSVGLGSVLSLQTSFLLVFLFSSGFNKEEVALFSRWIIRASVVMGVLGIIQFVTYQTLGWEGQKNVFSLGGHELPRSLTKYFVTNWGRASGTRSHPLTYAESFIPAFFLLVGSLSTRATDNKKMSLKVLSALSLIVCALGVFLSQSRGVWLAVGLAPLILTAFANTSFQRKILLLIFVGIFSLGLSHPALRGRFLSTFFKTHGTHSDQNSKTTRYKIWKESLDSFKHHPIIGVGLKGARLKVPEQDGFVKIWTESHNMYLQSLVDLGLPGLLLFLAVLFACLRRSMKIPGPPRIVFIGLILAIVIAGLTESLMGDREIALLFFSFIGMADFYAREKISELEL